MSKSRYSNVSSTVKISTKILTEFFEKVNPDHYVYLAYNENNYTRNNREQDLNLMDLEIEEIKVLFDMISSMEDFEGKKTLLWKITKYINILESFSTKCPKQLNDFSIALREFIKSKTYKFLLKSNGNLGVERLYRCGDITYEEYDLRQGKTANVRLKISYVERNELKTKSIVFETPDINGRGKTIENVLFSRGYSLANEEEYLEYKKTYERYCELTESVGEQFWVSGKVIPIKEAGQWYSTSIVDMKENKKKHVIDEESDYKVKQFFDDNGYYVTDQEIENNVEISHYQSIDHCILQMFCLENHTKIYACVEQLIPYSYNKDVYNNLILPDSHKECLNTILEFNPKDFNDVVDNKSGGVVVLASGPAGVGKTLSAETYSELIQRPLYSVQSAQLGINIDKIEINLKTVLERASRWRAVLLIDEADVFIRTRGNDLNQNAIVGVFLRVLEHFDGVLFMTTNRFLDKDGDQFVDDAILSRCVAHLRYDMPTNIAIKKIFEVQLKTLEVEFTECNLAEIIDYLSKYNISGRDIKNIIKLSKMFLKRENLKFIDINIIKKILPFHSTITRKS